VRDFRNAEEMCIRDRDKLKFPKRSSPSSLARLFRRGDDGLDLTRGKSLVGTIGRERLMKPQFMGALFIGVLGLAGEAQAHGGVSIDQGQCVMKIGPDTMTFTGYQPQKSREQFCDDIPDFGPTIIVLDAQQDELRDMTLDIRVLRNVGQKEMCIRDRRKG